MELGVECQRDLGGRDVYQLVFVVLSATKFTNDFAKRIVLRGANQRKVVHDEVVDGEDVGEFDVEGGLCSGIEVVECVDVELRFSIADVDH